MNTKLCFLPLWDHYISVDACAQAINFGRSCALCYILLHLLNFLNRSPRREEYLSNGIQRLRTARSEYHRHHAQDSAFLVDLPIILCHASYTELCPVLPPSPGRMRRSFESTEANLDSTHNRVEGKLVKTRYSLKSRNLLRRALNFAPSPSSPSPWLLSSDFHRLNSVRRSWGRVFVVLRER